MADTNEKECKRCGRKWVPSFILDCFEIDGMDICEPCAMPILMKSGLPEAVDQSRLKDVCKFGQKGAVCAFLVMSPAFACAKGSNLENILRQKLDAGTMKAKGGNCSGPPAFKAIVAQ